MQIERCKYGHTYDPKVSPVCPECLRLGYIRQDDRTNGEAVSQTLGFGSFGTASSGGSFPKTMPMNQPVGETEAIPKTVPMPQPVGGMEAFPKTVPMPQPVGGMEAFPKTVPMPQPVGGMEAFPKTVPMPQPVGGMEAFPKTVPMPRPVEDMEAFPKTVPMPQPVGGMEAFPKTVPMPQPVEGMGAFPKTVPMQSQEQAACSTGVSQEPEKPLLPVAGWLICLTGENRGRDYRIHQGHNYIGRHSNMDISFPDDPEISGCNHAILLYDEKSGKFYFASFGGAGLLLKNGRKVIGRTELRDGDRLQIGSNTYLFAALCGQKFHW